MVTVRSRLKWWRKRSYYLGESVSASVVNRITYDSKGNEKKSSAVIVDITIYTRSRNNAIERAERWIVPDADITNYLDKTAYRRAYSISSTIRTVMFYGRRRRWWR